MALTHEQAFKVGFLMKCAEDGLTIQETKQRVKLAIATAREKRALGLMDAVTGSAAPLLLGAPILAGAAGGYGLAKLQSPGASVVEDAKKDEVVGEYERLAEEAHRRARLKRLQSATGRRVIALTPGAE